MGDFLNVKFEPWWLLNISINWIISGFIAIIIVRVLPAIINKYFTKRSVFISEVEIGIGQASCTIKCTKDVKKIAYQIWVELVTRKVAIEIEEEDIICEVYDSWYKAFENIRELLKSVPPECLDDAGDLIKVSTEVLNRGLRPNLTKWQGKYRLWYCNAKKESGRTPQEIQKDYPDYTALWADMKETNAVMKKYADKLYEISFGHFSGSKE